MALNPSDSSTYTGETAPTYSTAGGYVPGQVESTNGGYDPNNPAAYLTSYNTAGGAAAVTETYNTAPNYDGALNQPGGYDPNTMGQDIYNGGGYDPNSIDPTSAAEIDNPRESVLADSGVPPGADPTSDPSNATDTPVAFQSITAAGTPQASQPSDDDWRVRISLAENSTIFYKDPKAGPILNPLVKTNGVVYPYTPQITVNHAASYNFVTPAHSNYAQAFYSHSDVSEIAITGDFTVQSVEEGKYVMACIYFFRAATKMFFGNGDNVGNPPPIVFLDGYGSHYFPHVPCVITGFQHVMPSEVDYILIPVTTSTLVETQISPDNAPAPGANNSLGDQVVPSILQSTPSTAAQTQYAYQSITTTTRVPAQSSITVNLKPVYSRKNLHDRFDLNKFANGGLLSGNGYGGFL